MALLTEMDLSDEYGVDVLEATTPTELAAVRSMFTRYMVWAEQQNPGRIAANSNGDASHTIELEAFMPPRGALFLAEKDGEFVGCAGLLPLSTGDCEIRNLFVEPDHRGTQIGRLLIRAALEAASANGYRAARLIGPSPSGYAATIFKQFGFQQRIPDCTRVGHWVDLECEL